MSNSQNGYEVIRSSGNSLLHLWKFPGIDRHLLLRRGSAGFILVHYAFTHHEEIERLDLGIWDEWGWAYRPIRGATTFSNHASGTAEDLNATKHPLGVPALATYTPAQLAKMRKVLAKYDECIRAGAFYQNRPDGMHFEVDRPLADVEKVAKRLSRSKRGKAILAVNPGQKAVIFS